MARGIWTTAATVLAGMVVLAAPAQAGESRRPAADPATKAAPARVAQRGKAAGAAPRADRKAAPGRDSVGKMTCSDEEWRRRLTPEQYKVLRGRGTEMPFSGSLTENPEPGWYQCGACGLVLFSSGAKFDSGSGWPSFWDASDPSHVRVLGDSSLGMVREEVRCARCGGHLGHLFGDGPAPTGMRYCINSAALTFVKDVSQKPPKHGR